MSESTLTIVFRGLMVFHQTVGRESIFEVGLLSPSHRHCEPIHIPRINTYKNGVLDSVFFMSGLHTNHRIWRLDVESPIGGVITDEQGAFCRASHEYKQDYRWLIDLEDNTEFYGPLTGKINTSLLNPVLRIPSGRFYTRLRSREMNRKKDYQPVMSFGRVSAAVGCDIKLEGSSADLVVADTGTPIFTFKDFQTENTLKDFQTENTLYEITNAPADTYKFKPREDHFQHYYEIFTAKDVPKFVFTPSSPLPGPSPALCGAVRLGQMTDNL